MRFRDRPSEVDVARLAEDLLDQGRAPEAAEVAGAGLRNRPDDARLMVAVGRAQLSSHDLLAAQGSFLKAARTAPRDKEPFRWLAEVMLLRNDGERAMKVIDRALGLDAQDAGLLGLRERAERLIRGEPVSGARISVRPAAAGPPKPPWRQRKLTTSEGRVPETSAGYAPPFQPAAQPPGRFERPPATRAEAGPATAMPGAEMPYAPEPAPPYAPEEPDQGGHAYDRPNYRDPSDAGAGYAQTARPPSAHPPSAHRPGVYPPSAHPPSAYPTATAGSSSDAGEVDRVLGVLDQGGLIEKRGEAERWARPGDVRPAGTRVGITMGAVWGVALLALAGGYIGYRAYLDQQREMAAEMVEAATLSAYRGDHADLVDAERELRLARSHNPLDPNGQTLLLFVHVERALEGGSFDAGFLRPTIARGAEVEADPAYLAVAKAVVAAAEGDQAAAQAQLTEAQQARPRDARILYAVGRLSQRLGAEDALSRLRQAAELEPRLTAAALSAAETLYDDGSAPEALALVESVLEREPEHLRATLWHAYMTAANGEPGARLEALGDLDARVTQHGAPTDRLLFELTRVRLMRRKGDDEGVVAAVDAALRAGADEPRLLVLVAIEGRRVGRLRRAGMAAQQAVAHAPSNPEYRKLLAEIQVARGLGRAALRTLAALDAHDPAVLRMIGQAALAVGSRSALTSAKDALDAYVQEHQDAGVAIQALRIRVHVELGEAGRFYPQARVLSREAPRDRDVSLALAAAALGTFKSDVAKRVLTRFLAADPDHAEAHYLLGRAHRMAADAEAAVASLRRAVELNPDHARATLTLGGLLLDTGQYEAAERLYARWTESARTAEGRTLAVAGRLGRAEALIGQRRFDEAEQALSGLSTEAQQSSAARLTRARLSMAQGNARAAARSLRGLAEASEASADVLALYGEALLASGRVSPAAATLARALSRDAGSPEALLGSAELALRGERSRDALALLTQAEQSLQRRIRPPAMTARRLTLLGRTYHSAGRQGRDDAQAALQRAIRTPGVPAEAYFFLGEVSSSGSAAAARRAYERYLELEPQGRYARRARRAL